MIMSNLEKIIDTYKKRAKSYDKDMVWLDKPALFEPISLSPFGNGKALDACAGTGCVATRLKKNGWNVTAVDVCADMLQHVSEGIECVVADVTSLPFDDSEFEISVCRQGLQYTDVELALSSLYRVTKTKVVVGHVTIEDIKDQSFWEEYFSVASPGRKNVFLPGSVKEVADNFSWRLLEEKVIYDTASLLLPIKYLDQKKQEQLYSVIKNTNQEFKDRNGITLIDGDIMYKRRWEFLTYTKT